MTEQTVRKPYVRKVPKTWFMQHVRYQKYMLRESSAVFLVIYTIILVVGVMRLSQSEAAYNGWLEALQHPLAILFHIVALLVVGYHMVCWFGATPKAMPPIRRGGERISAETIIKVNYAVWAVVSLFVIILAVL